MMNLTFRQLKVFESVARLGSYTKAADELYLSQPAVSMQVKLLEEQVTLPVFERIGKQLYITDAGKEVYQYARQIIQQKKDVEETLEQMKDLQRGHLNIAVVSTANHFLIRILAAFEKLYPKIRISLNVTNRSELLQAIQYNESDLGIMGKPPFGAHLKWNDFLDNPLVAIAAPNHPLAQQEGLISLDEFAKQKFIVREQGSGTRKACEKFFEKNRIEFNPTMDMSNGSAIKHAVEEGLGLAIVSRHTLSVELKANTLKILNIDGLPIIRKWYVVESPDKRLSPIALEFKKFIIENSFMFVK